MKERPILFSAPMVRAILEGRKTQTRRVVNPQPGHRWNHLDGLTFCTGEHDKEIGCSGDVTLRCPYGQAGDRLYVRETWRTYGSLDHLPPRSIAAGAGVQYEAGGTNVRSAPDRLHGMGKTRRAIHMPRWASRIDLEVTGVRVQLLNNISDGDAMAEGAAPVLVPPDGGSCPHAEGFRELWQSINGAESWAANPFSWVVEFKRVKP